ncbi:MAG: hypothetical protein K9H64_00520 [Bacteroidales bacterium]|nr:hypothetical protein [Bacteroidales bacterium]MCF8454376.1 hypothetical protein [Bacteroidales bacterium]
MKVLYQLIMALFFCVVFNQSYSQSIEHEWIYFNEWDSIWAPGIQYAHTIDNSGNIIFSFYYQSFNEMTWFGDTFPGGNPNNCNYPAITSTYSCFIPYVFETIKVSPNGLVLWRKNVGMDKFCTDANNNIYSTRNLSQFTPTIIANDTLLGSSALVKLDSMGNELWGKAFIFTNSIYFPSNFVFYQNYLYVWLMHKEPVSYNGIYISSGIGTDLDGLLMKIDSLGNLAWSRHITGPGNHWLNLIGIDQNGIHFRVSTNSSDIYFEGSLIYSNSGPNNYENIYLNIGFSGNIVNQKAIPDNYFILSEIKPSGNFLAYRIFNTTTFVIGSDTLLNTGSNSAMAVMELDTSFNLVWSKVFSSSGLLQSMPVIFSFEDITAISFYSIENSLIGYNLNSGPAICLLDPLGNVLDFKNIVEGYFVHGSHFHKDDLNNIYTIGYTSQEYVIYEGDTLTMVTNPNITPWYLDWFYLSKTHISIPETGRHDINLLQGWNLISTYMVPYNPAVDVVFAPIDSVIKIVKEENGMVYWPQYNINTIGDMDIEEGYLVKVDSNAVLSVFGYPVQPDTTGIGLNMGWNIMSYLRQSPALIDSMLVPVTSNIVICKNGQGQVFWPQYSVNTIVDMYPGQGYQIKMMQTDTLFYPPN